jgi:hypothetical protein
MILKIVFLKSAENIIDNWYYSKLIECQTNLNILTHLKIHQDYKEIQDLNQE